MPAVDLPDNVAASIQSESVLSATQTARNARDAASLAMNTLQAGVVATQNLLGTSTVARAVSGINATELAGPTNPAPKSA